MSKFLAFTANPDPESLTQYIGKAFLEGAASKGASTEFVDLHAIGFDPTYRMADRKQYLAEAPMPDDAAALQRRSSMPTSSRWSARSTGARCPR